jgi:hypothetical protein
VTHERTQIAVVRLFQPAVPTPPVALPHPSRGLAVLPGPTAESTRVFLCDPIRRQIRVLNGRGTVVTAFGNDGIGGVLGWPSDVLVVRPEFAGEQLDGELADAAWLVVADRGHGCLHLFETDGAYLGRLGGGPGRLIPQTGHRPGWPFFRLRPAVCLPQAPIGLAWDAPRLTVTTTMGELVHVDLAYEMLLPFEEWLAAAAPGELMAARRHFRARGHAGELQPDRIVDLETALGRTLVATSQFSQAALAWSSEWPRGSSAAARRVALQARFQIVSRAAFSSGAFAPLRDVQRVLNTQASRLGTRRPVIPPSVVHAVEPSTTASSAC